MTDRIKALTVVLTHDIRDDDITALADAIRQFRSVLSVTNSVANIEDYVAQERARYALMQKLREVLA